MELYLLLGIGILLFCLGVVGFLVRTNAVVLLLSVELMLNAANLVFIVFSRYLHGTDGQIYVFIVMAIAAAEVAVGLAVMISIFRLYGLLDISKIRLLRG
ncbi:MAG: NADH-quinone oxidoreductase subunit NuoK [Syntrophales bacterium]|jgi:NADH-quinone oxidoreductase subunit K|nr:NADH-quinone oxidoreductase subunit NuoK [Syntrophales bacterium]MCK9527236.1 NADH-quinone oxidoreductase subunit NuoK [Syntrophales bacterium]MDX9921294.1 NADH-quinone oxidoreductase subunit NuoK [Syntrophales bacterium]